MFDDTRAYFQENIVESFVAYRTIRDDGKYGKSHDLRAALTSAIALYHFREHLPDSIMKSRSEIAASCASYDLLGNIADASKHKKLTQGQPQFTTAENLYEQVVITRYEDASGEYFDAEKLVVVKLPDGTERDVLELLTDVINFWGTVLVNAAILDSFRQFDQRPPPGSRYVPREKAFSLDIEIIRGVRFKQPIKLLKYDKATGKADLIDLSGHKVNFRIYKPAYTVDVDLVHDETGKITKHTFDLSEEQTLELDGLETASQREDFMRKLAFEKQKEFSRLIQEAKATQGSIDE